MGNWSKLIATGAVTLAASAAVTAARAEPARVVITVDGPGLVKPDGSALYALGEAVQDGKVDWLCTDKAFTLMDDQQSGLGPHAAIGHRFIKSCLEKYRPYVAAADARPEGAFGKVQRPDGTWQWTYRASPLYTALKDRAPGERNGTPGRGLGAGIRVGVGPGNPEMTLPPGFRAARRAEGYVLVTRDTGRAVYVARGDGRVQQASSGREDFKPIPAPAIATVSGDWSVIDDGTGRKQYAFKGRPLFAAAPSLNELEIAGARNWEPVVLVPAPPFPGAVTEHLSLAGHVFATAQGRTLYTYNCTAGGGQLRARFFAVACDDAGDAAAGMVALCGDAQECARRWRPYLAARGAKPVGEFSIVEITYPMFADMRGTLYPADAPKAKAWAYKGKPLFTYYEDEKPGDIWGDGIGGIWGSSFSALIVPGKDATTFEP